MTHAHESTLVEHVSALNFRTTHARLVDAIQAAGMTIFATIDHADAANSVGLTMPPTTVLIYGNPKGGTPLMLQAPEAALDLPLRVLLREDTSNRVLVSFHEIVPMLTRAGVPEAMAARLQPAQALLIEAIKNA